MSLRYALLSFLAHRGLSGYELMNLLDGSVGLAWHATHPQIYRELHKMAKDRHVTSSTVSQHDRPDKKVYMLTEQGRAVLIEWLAESPPLQRVKDEMMLHALCFGLVDQEVAIEQLHAQRELHQERVAQLKLLMEVAQAGPSHPIQLGTILTTQRGLLDSQAYIEWCNWAIGHISNGGSDVSALNSVAS
ncbi:MAG: PadR family transcriptional regulator AphA [Hyphomicrobiaceae bacterium]|jgi:PadR family transcriptional regulator AphA